MDYKLEFRDIEYISMLARCRSFTLAAKNLHITQPALSIYIKNLEQRMGIQLFIRKDAQFMLTNAGKYILENGQQILTLRDQIQQKLFEYGGESKKRIRIGFTPIRGMSFFPLVLSEFKKCNPDVEVFGCEAAAVELEKMVLEGDLDIAFYNMVKKNPLLKYDLILSDSTVLFISPELAEKQQIQNREEYPHPWIDLKQMKDYPFIRNLYTQNTEQITLQVFDDYQIDPPVAARISNQLTALNLAAYNCGVYLAPEYFYYNTNFIKELVILSIGASPNLYNLDFIAATLKGRNLSDETRNLIETTKRVYNYKQFFLKGPRVS